MKALSPVRKTIVSLAMIAFLISPLPALSAQTSTQEKLNSADAYIKRGLTHHNRGDFKNAIADFEP
jgi:hypothetical protein